MHKRRFISLNAYILSIILVFVIIFLLFMVYTYTNTTQILDMYIQEIGTSSVTMSGRLIDQMLYSIDQYAYSFLYNNTAINALSQEQTDELTRYHAKKELIQEFSKISLLYSPDGMLIYSVGGDEAETIIHSSRNNRFRQNHIVAEAVISSFSTLAHPGAIPNSEWFLFDVEEQTYLIRTVFLNNTYFAIWFEPNSLIGMVQDDSSDDAKFSGKYFLASKSEQEHGAYTPDRVLQYSSIVGDFNICLSSNIDGFYASRQYTFFAVSIILIVVILVVLLFNHKIRISLNTFSHTMKQISKGNLSIRMKYDTNIQEIFETYTVFNQLIGNIETLKMETYEKHLQVQRIKQQFLHIQLRNHFFLNCLNIIYSLALVGDCDLIENLSLYLSGYFRHISMDAMQPVTLQDEVEHVNNYVSIQQIRFPDRIEYACEMDSDLSSFFIPPLLILTFIENCIIHIKRPQRFVIKIRLCLTSTQIQGHPALHIHIEDNGKGFSIEQLEQFNSKDIPFQFKNKGGVGIHNVRDRLNLLYGENMRLVFSNKPDDHGACIDIDIPSWPDTIPNHTLKEGEHV